MLCNKCSLQLIPKIVKPPNTLRFRYQNVHGLPTKADVVLSSSSGCDEEAVFITENWLADGVDNREFLDPAFVVYKSDK
ncbi:hypothetical protein Trydic_g11154 [Trypoxylus dichotomus]